MGIISAAFILLFKRGNPLNWIFNVGSWLLGGVILSRERSSRVGPEGLRLHPHDACLEALRILLLGRGNLRMTADHLVCLAAWAATALPLGCAFFVYALKRARAKGSIGHY